MLTRNSLKGLVLEALKANGGSTRVVEVYKYILENYEVDLRSSGDLFYTWQYDVRWAAQKLRYSGKLRAVKNSRSPWTLA